MLKRSRRARRGQGAIVPLLAALLAGCHVYTPVSTTPQPGVRFAFDLNDRGRVGVADSLGPEVARVDGVLLRSTDSLYVVQVKAVQGIRGSSRHWSDETVSLRREYVRDISERRLSKQRTALVAGGAVLAVVAFIASRELLGFGGGGDDDGDPPVEPAARRGARRTLAAPSIGARSALGAVQPRYP
ncbi:MAG: hypothetical protein WKG32_07760 [Gemmatimonadaceae bacterium]